MQRALLTLALALVGLAALAGASEEDPDTGNWIPIYEHGVEVFENVETVHMCDANDTTNW